VFRQVVFLESALGWDCEGMNHPLHMVELTQLLVNSC